MWAITTTKDGVPRDQKKLDNMRQQWNMFQTREKDKNTQKQLNEEEIDNLPEKEFRVMLVKMIQDFRKRMKAGIKKLQEM